MLRAVKKLTRESIGDEQRYTIKGLQALAELTAQKRKELRKALGDALEKAPCVESTGERSFAAVAESVKDLASREILEALVRYARIKLMEAKVCEEEVIGLRLYSGPFFVKVNFVLRNKGMTTGGTNYSNLIHAIVSGTSKLSQVSGIPEDRELYRGIGDTHQDVRRRFTQPPERDQGEPQLSHMVNFQPPQRLALPSSSLISSRATIGAAFWFSPVRRLPSTTQ